MRKAASRSMWAAIGKTSRTEWIIDDTVRRTRAEARAAYLARWNPAYHAEVLKRTRFARVVVSLKSAAPKEQP